MNDSPVDCQSRERPSAMFAKQTRQRCFCISCVDSRRENLRRLENIVVSRVAKVTSDTPYFLRALHEKQLSTVFRSFTRKETLRSKLPHGGKAYMI